jgi:hypothetical protein
MATVLEAFDIHGGVFAGAPSGSIDVQTSRIVAAAKATLAEVLTRYELPFPSGSARTCEKSSG